MEFWILIYAKISGFLCRFSLIFDLIMKFKFQERKKIEFLIENYGNFGGSLTFWIAKCLIASSRNGGSSEFLNLGYFELASIG